MEPVALEREDASPQESHRHIQTTCDTIHVRYRRQSVKVGRMECGATLGTRRAVTVVCCNVVCSNSNSNKQR